MHDEPGPLRLSSNSVSWPIAGAPGSFTPPPQGPRVQSFATEVAARTTTTLNWPLPKPGTYLLESGTHPSIQGPMGLYGILVVTAAPTATTSVPITETAAGCAYPGANSGSCAVAYDAEIPLLLSEIDPVQNNLVNIAVNSVGFQETTVWSGQSGGCGNPSTANAGNCYPPTVNYTPLYYTINGVAFNKTNATGSLFPITPAMIAPASAQGECWCALSTQDCGCTFLPLSDRKLQAKRERQIPLLPASRSSPKTAILFPVFPR